MRNLTRYSIPRIWQATYGRKGDFPCLIIVVPTRFCRIMVTIEASGEAADRLRKRLSTTHFIEEEIRRTVEKQ
jgi:hypothetical protein